MLRWLVAYPLALLAGGLAATLAYLAFWLAAGMGVPFVKVVGVVVACAAGAHTFVSLAGRLAPEAHVGAALAAAGLVLIPAAFLWFRLPLPAALPVVLPLVLGAAGGAMAVRHGEREKERRGGGGAGCRTASRQHASTGLTVPSSSLRPALVVLTVKPFALTRDHARVRP
jgi:hypothetical protein